MNKNTRNPMCIFVCLLLLLLVALPLRAQHSDTHTAAPEDAPAIAIIPSDGFNMRVVEQITPYYVITTLDPPVFNWFAGTFTNLPTDQEVTIGLNMTGVDSPPNKAEVSKWVGLKPLLTYADPTRYESYEWFQKDEQDQWMSGDPFKKGEAKFAGTGKVPEQSIIPNDLAEQFLSADGDYWQAWREIETVEVLTNANIFRIKYHFALSTATVAMRIPYTYSYLQAFLEHLQAAGIAGVNIDKIGTTPDGRILQAIRIEGQSIMSDVKDNKTVLVIAREHATEHASSWALHGILALFINGNAEINANRNNITWILIPIQDPDGSANSQFDRLTEKCYRANDPSTPVEIFDYARYLTDYVNSGKSIDVSVVLHNVEANECRHLLCPFFDIRFVDQTIDFNRKLFTDLQNAGFQTELPETNYGKGWMNFRIYGWCALHFGSFDLAYEVNDRYPADRLSLSRIGNIGAMLSKSIAKWLSDDNGKIWHRDILKLLSDRQKERDDMFRKRGYGPDQKSKFDLLIRGY